MKPNAEIYQIPIIRGLSCFDQRIGQSLFMVRKIDAAPRARDENVSAPECRIEADTPLHLKFPRCQFLPRPPLF